MDATANLTNGAKVNSTRLYVRITNIILKAKDPEDWKDLSRLLPNLRNSLSCAVCTNLLQLPYSPRMVQCQHNVCKKCSGGIKKIKPACDNCKDCNDYVENPRLHALLQCYNAMCMYIKNKPIFKMLSRYGVGENNMFNLINEGATLVDTFDDSNGILEPVCFNLPQYSSTQMFNSASANPPSFYSILSPENGSKITLKRKYKEDKKKTVVSQHVKDLEKPLFKRPTTNVKKKGCRCGNATRFPGKLTCCGQRCPCYVAQKPCVGCRCRGCRNPHIKEGQKVIPNLSQGPKILYNITGIQNRGIKEIEVPQQNFNNKDLQKLKMQKQILQIPQDVLITDHMKVSDIQKVVPQHSFNIKGLQNMQMQQQIIQISSQDALSTDHVKVQDAKKINVPQLQTLRTSTITKPQVIPCNLDALVAEDDLETVSLAELNLDSQFVSFSPLGNVKTNLPHEFVDSYSTLPELIPISYSDDNPELGVM
ncbi:unnamed protein product [Diabrotica balteata]|uniref:Uncharacterized protein n=1 Tax=Diabrotica balteata TaxID=107213 RepID=A0A9N9T9I8_DIABA|nr:unnamed protein product [Diabrotica balteata]